MPMIGIKSKGSGMDAATIDVDRVERRGYTVHLFCAGVHVGRLYLDIAEIDDDLAELLRVYDAAQMKEKV